MLFRFGFRFVRRALEYRKQRLLLSFSALAIAAALATVLFGIYETVERRMRDEFRSYGANIAAVPVSGKTVPLALAAAAEKLGAAAAPFLITSAGSTVVAGFVPSKTADMTSYWHMQGSRGIGPGECIAGETLAARLHLAIGSQTPICAVRLKGIVSTGGAEDQELLVPFETAASWPASTMPPASSKFARRAIRSSTIRAALAAQFPAADVRTNLAVAGPNRMSWFERSARRSSC
jgi:hypothetical protein